MKVKFLPLNVEHEIEFNETVLHLAQRHDIHIQSVCKGLPSCAECRVQIKEGEHHVLPPSSKEVSLIGTAHYIDRSRLSCQLRCFGDLTIDVSEQLEKEKRASKRPQGRASRADGEESFAVKGNIIEEYVPDPNDSIEVQQAKQKEFHQKNQQQKQQNSNQNRHQQARGQNNPQNKGQNRDSHRDRNNRHGPQNQGKNENNRNRNSHQNQKSSQNSKGLQGGPRSPSPSQKPNENKGNS